MKGTGATARTTVKRILAHWDRANDTNREDGAQWYLLNGILIEQIAQDSQRDRETVAAVAAHLSPRVQWSKALICTSEMVKHDTPISGFTTASIANARRAMASDDPLSTLRGPKVKSFAANLLGCPDSVTVDVWAMRVAYGRDRDDLDKILQRVGVYDSTAHCYRLAARRVGVTPATMQATTWIVARNGRAA